MLKMCAPIKNIIDQIRYQNNTDRLRDNQERLSNTDIVKKNKLSSQAEKTADVIVKSFWSDKDRPFNIINLLKVLEFKLYQNNNFTDSSLSGGIALEVKDNNQISRRIVVNGRDSIGHIRFTLAHELAHFLFDALPNEDYYEAYYRTDTNNDIVREYRANKFAANLLMPKDLFFKRYQYVCSRLQDRDNIINTLSQIFGVSVTAVEKRIQEMRL